MQAYAGDADRKQLQSQSQSRMEISNSFTSRSTDDARVERHEAFEKTYRIRARAKQRPSSKNSSLTRLLSSRQIFVGRQLHFAVLEL